MYFVYILQSTIDKKYYIGSTNNIKERLNTHNRGSVKSTKARRPLEVIWIEEHDTRRDAQKRERQIKSFKGGDAFKQMIL